MLQNKEEIYFSFISRSGGHAIIYWVASMLKQNVRYDHHWRDKSKLVFFSEGKEVRKKTREYDEFSIRLFSIENEPYTYMDPKFPDIVVIRSPENLYASLLKKSEQKWYCESNKIQEIYMDHCSNSAYKIIYDLWFQSEKYRKKVAKDLGLQYSDQSLQHVPSFGSGSSFDKRNLNNKASEMKVLERWKQVPQEKLDEFFKVNNQMKKAYNFLEKSHLKFC